MSLVTHGLPIGETKPNKRSQLTGEQSLEGIVEFANYIDAVFLVEENFEIIEPTVEALVGRMRESNASRFVEDPNNFLESISSGKIKIRGVL